MKGCSIYWWYVEEPRESQNVMLTNNNSSYVLQCQNMSLTYHSSYYINFNLQLPLILTCTVRWMHDVLIEKVKPCSMLVKMFTLSFNMPTYRREESVFLFVSKPKIIPINSHEHQIKDRKILLQTKLFFSKANEKGENLFS